MEDTYETIDLRELFYILKNNIVFIIVTTLAVTLAGAFVTFFLITPQYEAATTMIVNTRQDQNATVTNDQITSARNLVDTYSIIVKSDTVLDQVIRDLNMDMDYDTLQKKVTVSAVDSTQVMRVAVQDPSPEWAHAIAAKIAEIAPDIIQDMVEAGSVKVISEARVGDAPVSPRKLQNLAISMLIGLVVSVGIAFLRELLNNTFKTDEDIQKHLGLAVLGVIPEIEVD